MSDQQRPKKDKKKHLRPRLRAMRGARGGGKRGGLMNQPCKGENLRDRYGFNTPAGCGGFIASRIPPGPGGSITWVLRRPQTAPRARKWTPEVAKERPETPKVSPEDLQNGTIVGLTGPKWVPRWSQRGTSGTCWIGILFSAKCFAQF